MQDSQINENNREKDGDKKQSKSQAGRKMAKGFQGILKWLWTVLLLPFQLLIHFAHLLNEIRLLILSLLTIVGVCVVALALVVIFKPDWAWLPLKDFLNAGVVLEQPTESVEQIIYSKINEQFVKPGDIQLNNNELTTLFRKSGLISRDSIVQAKKDSLLFYINIDSKEKPLWLVVTAKKQQNGNLTIAEIGFVRFNLPPFVANLADASFAKITDLLAKQNGKDSAVILFNQLIDARLLLDGLQLKEVELTDGYAILKYLVIIKP